MKVLIASAEAAPFAKVGGLADVVGSLPAALREEGIDARVIMPGYGFIDHQKYQISRLFTFKFTHRTGTSEVDVYTCVRDGVPFYMVQAWPYFGQDPAVYTEWDWDVPRFIFFNQVIMAVAWELDRRLGWHADVIHANDWHTGLVPFLIAESRSKPEWQQTATMITIHNIAYQGNGVGGSLWDAGVSPRTHPLLQAYHLTDNLLGIGIAYADTVTTVSPRYAVEIQYPSAGYELAELIQSRQADLHGILNGIDTRLWNPETDPMLVARYTSTNYEEQRLINKRHLQAYARLDIRDDVPLIGMVSRLTWQKGIDLAAPALRSLLPDQEVQFVVLGTGEPALEQALMDLQRDFPTQAAAFIGYDAALAQHIYAGADMFLMPSHFEPCGIGQMIAMRYGALPVVRETGGLADTVTNYDGENADTGNGFVFLWEEPDAVVGTLNWALETYYERPKAWRRMQRRAMQTEFSWRGSARQYIELYQKSTQKRKQTVLEEER